MIQEQNFSVKVKAAYIVLLCSESYAVGVKVLNWSLKSVKCEYPLIVLHTGAVPVSIIQDLEKSGCIMLPATDIEIGAEDTNYAQPYYQHVWAKLNVFNLTEYSRLVLLDADMLVRKNLDHLMTIEIPKGWIGASPGCLCNPFHISTYPVEWKPERCPYNISNENNDVISYFNSGLLIIEPSAELFLEITNRLKTIKCLEKYPFPDQDFLNEFFCDKWIRLPYHYNALRPLLISHPKMWKDTEIHVVHYIFTKPWLDSEWMSKSESEKKESKFCNVNSWWFDSYEKSKT